MPDPAMKTTLHNAKKIQQDQRRDRGDGNRAEAAQPIRKEEEHDRRKSDTPPSLNSNRSMWFPGKTPGAAQNRHAGSGWQVISSTGASS
jgi:hypothetical protein